MYSLKCLAVGSCLLALAWAKPSPQAGLCPNGQPWNIIPDTPGNVDAAGCTVGYCSKNCPTGAFTNDGRKNTFRGNVGAKNTGSNGNAGPISADGLPVDPAAQTYLKQIAAYQLWAEKQVSNAERDIANQNANQARIPIGRAGPAQN